MGILGTLAAVGMAVGPPLIYADQAFSIIRKKDSTGFSHDVCGVLLVANIIRIYFWLGNRFEIPLLIQSILLIASQLLLLSICLHYRPFDEPGTAYSAAPTFDADAEDEAEHGARSESGAKPVRLTGQSPQSHDVQSDDVEAGRDEAGYESRTTSPLVPSHPQMPSPSAFPRSGHRQIGGGQAGTNGSASGWQGRITSIGAHRPFDFWQWESVGSYAEFLAGLILVLGVLQMISGRWEWYIDSIGFLGLVIESTLPIPQFISNYKRKSCYGFRSSTLAGWLFGDIFKTGYFFIRNAPTQFKVTAIMTVCWDLAVLAQRIAYKADPPRGNHGGSEAGAGGNDNEEREGLRGNG